MKRVVDIYMDVYAQGFVPIFVNDNLDGRMLVDACVNAGVGAIEYTMRRKDFREVIPWIRKTYPSLTLLIGSTIDDEKIVRSVRKDNPQLMTMSELSDLGVSGFISMMGMCKETIEKYKDNQLLVPTAWTLNEALQMLGYGAHFVKVMGPALTRLREFRAEPTFGFCPIFMTGGMDLSRIPDAIAEGAILIGSGFDIMLKDKPANLTRANIENVIKEYISVTQEARLQFLPQIQKLKNVSSESFISSLPHYQQIFPPED